MHDAVGKGIYTVPFAAKLANARYENVRRWVKGAHHGKPAVLEIEDIGLGPHAISFRNLIEILILAQLRKSNVSMHEIRRAHEKLRQMLETQHPFLSVKFKTQGRKLIADYLTRDGKRVLERPATGQTEAAPVVDPLLSALDEHVIPLFADFGYAEQHVARWYPLGAERAVVIDPRFKFGQPVIGRVNVPVSAIAEFARHNDAEAAVELYGVQPNEVRDALAFEEQFGLAKPGRTPAKPN